MRASFLSITLFITTVLSAQVDRDTVVSRCPVFITDTLTSNNFFLEQQPATIRVYRTKGDLVIAIQQREQFFTLFFNDKKLKSGTTYKITVGSDKKSHVEAKYSFRSGGTASYVNVSKGTVEVNFDKEKDYWNIKLNGMLMNLVERNITYYRVRSNFYIR